MSKLHLVTNEKFNYMAYVAVMSAIRFNEVVFWYGVEPESKYFDIIKKVKSIEFKKIDPVGGISLGRDDNTGRLDIVYLSEFVKDVSFEDAFIKNDVFVPEDIGEFEKKDITLVKVNVPEGQESLDFINKEWVAESGTLLASLIKTVLLERVWNR